ncbi:Deoxycytidine kinase 1 [Rhodotorula toruloides]|uniref:BY PROTMAP: gi/647400045/emb/CDR45150.1/ RHTO0S10e05556g1_1 [Rhodosporidium toruloides] n=1 Tax=Rhodotorula toruloides TaxID=5286 RepID=A0A0K3CJP9_RHOTO
MDADDPPIGTSFAEAAITILEGSWRPLNEPGHGIVHASFLPLTQLQTVVDAVAEYREELNPHQVPLEVGDEVYIVEVFHPSSPSPTDVRWYRGYVLSTSSRQADPYALATSSHPPFRTDHPSAIFGIFPAAHIALQDDVAGEIAAPDSHDKPNGTSRTSELERTASRRRDGEMRMESLQEEEEPEDDDGRALVERRQHQAPNGATLPASPRKRSRNCASITSLGSVGGSFQSARLSRLGLASPGADERSPPPLPSLKCGDETSSGVDEPLIDEIACALREWQNLMHAHLVRGAYTLFETVAEHSDALHGMRQQLFSKSLGSADAARLRREAVAHLVAGNAAQGLDIIVRHPGSGALVETKVEGDVDEKAWMTVPELYKTQVALGYSPSAPSQSHAHPSSVRLDFQGLVGNLATPGEILELYFSLFSKAESRYVTEEACILIDHEGTLVGNQTRQTVFRDLTKNDMQSELYLVCRIIRNGFYRSSGSISTAGAPPRSVSRNGLSLASSRHSARSDAASLDSAPSPATLDVSPAPEAMLHRDSAGHKSCRRPFGAAVADLAAMTARQSPITVPIFVPVDEATFSTLHEDLIHSRTRRFEQTPHAQHITVEIEYLSPDDDKRDLVECSVTPRLDFPDVSSKEQRNDFYVKLWSGEFYRSGSGTATVRSLAQLAAAGGSAGSFEISAEVRSRYGQPLDGSLSRGAGQQPVSAFVSTVYKGAENPSWGELFKVSLPPEEFVDSHLFLTVRDRNSRSDLPFAFAYLSFLRDGTAVQADGTHSLVLYKYDEAIASPAFYFQVPAKRDSDSEPPSIPPSVSKTLVPLRDSIKLRTFLVSTALSQDDVLLRLLRWPETLARQPDAISDTLTKLRFSPEAEIVRFLPDVLDALFALCASPANSTGHLDRLAYEALISVLGIVHDRRFTGFSDALDEYIARHFSEPSAGRLVLRTLQSLLRHPEDSAAASLLRSSIKVWRWLFGLAMRADEISQSQGDDGADDSQAAFRNEVVGLLAEVNALMRTTRPASIVGTQTLIVQHFASILPLLASVFGEEETIEVVLSFIESTGELKGKALVWRLLLLNEVVRSSAFTSPAARAAFVPGLVRAVKACLGTFDELAMCAPNASQVARDTARTAWVEELRLAISVLSSAIDVVQNALVYPNIRSDRSLFAQEQDNVEYLLSLVPRLLDSLDEFEDPVNADAIERQRTPPASVLDIPITFPSSYPFPLLARSPTTGAGAAPSGSVTGRYIQPAVGEAVCTVLALIHLASPQTLIGWLDSLREVEGPDKLADLLSQICRLAMSTMEHDRLPETWLTFGLFAHRTAFKFAEAVDIVVRRHFLPPEDAAFSFRTVLWEDYLSMVLSLVSSPQLTIENFSPQKRRAVWQLSGDLRAEGAALLDRAWTSLAFVDDRSTPSSSTYGGYQAQLVPALLSKVLSTCLSQHDTLRRVGVATLRAMILSEYELNGELDAFEAATIGHLDSLFGARDHVDAAASRTFFVAELRQLFDERDLKDDQRTRILAFLDSIDSFLELLLSVKTLPEGDEFQEDRIASTLRLMTFIRSIGRTDIFVRYVQRLVDYHLAAGNFVEAGLTLKLYADLYDWNNAASLDPVPDLHLPKQTEFARREALFNRIIDHLARGKAWETAIELATELEKQYETKTFDYVKLADLLRIKADLFASIAKSERQFGSHFRVAYYGSHWPASVAGKQFVHCGSETETLGAFIERMLNKHPSAQLLRTSSIPGEEVQYGETQYLQITAVSPEYNRSHPLLASADVPHFAKAWHLHHGSTFSFTRPLAKDAHGRSLSTNDFTSLWTEKTVLITEDEFPTVLPRSEVVEIRLIEISPIENALADIATKRDELETLERRYKDVMQRAEEGTKVNINPLSMALNGVIDAPVNQGVPMYRRAFLAPEMIANSPPAQVALVRQLETAIDELVVTVARCLKLHALLCTADMQAFHETLEKFFEKNFAAEIARLPEPAIYQPAGFAALSPNTASAPIFSSPSAARAYGSISITSPRSATSPPSSRNNSISAQAVDDQWLRVKSPTSSTSPIPAPVDVRKAASVAASDKDRPFSPTRPLSLFSRRSSSPAAEPAPKAEEGSGTGLGRRASLLSSAVKKLGGGGGGGGGAKRKASFPAVPEE